MRYFLSVLAAAALSLIAYLFVFGFLVSRPLVIDQIKGLMDKKLAYAHATKHPKIFLVAGSNARFSHSCAVLEQILHRPCINMGIAADVALDWTLDEVRPLLAPGDLVYMPVEYEIYSRPPVTMMTGMDAAYRFRHDKGSLMSRGPEGILRAAFMFSLPTLVQSLGEMGLQVGGVQRRFNVDTIDRQGDETGHDGEKAVPYLDVIRQSPQVSPVPETLLEHPEGAQAIIGGFLDWCHAHGVTVVGGLPTVFNDHPIADGVIMKLKAFYAAHGAVFLVLPDRSQYSRTDFYDSPYHLRQSSQQRHSQILAKNLMPFLPRSP